MCVTVQAGSSAASWCTPSAPSQTLPTAGTHSGLLFCSVKMCWPKAAAAVLNFSTAVTKGPEWGTTGLVLLGDTGLPKTPCWGLHTQADVLLL